MTNGSPILIVDDEPAICWGFERLLGEEGFHVFTAGSAEKGLELAKETKPALVVLDVRLPGEDGLSALPRFREAIGEAPVIVITAFGDLETAVRAVREGAADYLTKPFRIEDALRILHAALKKQSAPVEELATAAESSAHTNSSLVGRSAAMQKVYRQIAMVADSDLSVLITGETGTGKELIAKAIHENSHRKAGPYLPIAPVALNPSLIESELFGHARGAFTGATEDRDGLFALAGGGTILLDEIGDLPLNTQVKLLRVLEQREFTPVGGGRARESDVRILAATNADLRAASDRDEFRRDLYFRLAAVEIHAPPLRERLEDIELLAHHFLSLARLEVSPKQLTPEVLRELRQRPWHGNVRELRNTIEHAAVVSRGQPIRVDHLPAPMPAGSPISGKMNVENLPEMVRAWARHEIGQGADGESNLHDRFLAVVEPSLLEAALEATSGNRAAAAELLGIHRGTLRERLKRYGLA